MIKSMEGRVKIKSVPQYLSLLILELTASPRGKIKSIMTFLCGAPGLSLVMNSEL